MLRSSEEQEIPLKTIGRGLGNTNGKGQQTKSDARGIVFMGRRYCEKDREGKGQVSGRGKRLEVEKIRLEVCDLDSHPYMFDNTTTNHKAKV